MASMSRQARTKHRMVQEGYQHTLKVMVDSGDPKPVTKGDENALIKKNLHVGEKTAEVWRQGIKRGVPVYISAYTLNAIRGIMCDDDYKAFLVETLKPVPPVKEEVAAMVVPATPAPAIHPAAEKLKMTPEERKAYEAAIALTRPQRRLTLLRLGEIKQEIKDATGVEEVTSSTIAKFFGGHFSGIQVERWMQAAKIDNPHTMQPHVYARYVQAIADAKEKLAKLPPAPVMGALVAPAAPLPFTPEVAERTEVVDSITDLEDGDREIVIDGEKFKVTAFCTAAGMAEQPIGFLNYLSRQIEIALKMKGKMREIEELQAQSSALA